MDDVSNPTPEQEKPALLATLEKIRDAKRALLGAVSHNHRKVYPPSAIARRRSRRQMAKSSRRANRG